VRGVDHTTVVSFLWVGCELVLSPLSSVNMVIM
jgi:hypothetical protein